MPHVHKVALNRRTTAIALAIVIGWSSSVSVAQAPAPSPPSAAEVAASPAATRLKELLALFDGGKPDAVLAYVNANAIDPLKAPPGPMGMPMAAMALDMRQRSNGFELLRFEVAEPGTAVARVRNRLTQDTHALSVKIEAAAPHRITAIGIPLRTLKGPIAPDNRLSEPERFARIGDFLQQLAGADAFSGTVVIAREGKPVFAKAYGFADRGRKIPNRLDTPFLLGSMNKLFTGIAIGQLVDRGELSYDDPLSKFVPGFPDAENAKRITVRHLLTHTSGLGSYFNPRFFASLDRLRTVQDIIDVSGTEPPEFDPGTKWRYSNIGFQLLGRVIEVASGTDYYSYMRSNVFAPAGVKRDLFPHYDRTATGMARPYDLSFDGSKLELADQTATSPRRGGPAGGGIASALDLLKLAEAMRTGRLVTPETLALHSAAKPEMASPMYGYGVSVGARMAKRPLIGHGGNAPGQCTEFGFLTDTPYTIIVLSNARIQGCMIVVGRMLEVLGPTRPAVPIASVRRGEESPGRVGDRKCSAGVGPA